MSSGFEGGSCWIHLNEIGCWFEVAGCWVFGIGWFGTGYLEVEEHQVVDYLRGLLARL